MRMGSFSCMFAQIHDKLLNSAKFLFFFADLKSKSHTTQRPASLL